MKSPVFNFETSAGSIFPSFAVNKLCDFVTFTDLPLSVFISYNSSFIGCLTKLVIFTISFFNVFY